MKKINDRIHYLKKALERAFTIEEKQIANKIKSIGFKCRNCAQCCRESYGDNAVAVFPFEIRRISEKTGLSFEEIVVPTPSEDRDSEGSIHTFEWVLRRKGDCSFLDGRRCKIYECRPYICRTYPFYLMDGRLFVSECKGVGGEMSEKESLRLAAQLKERYITEIRETLSLFEKFSGMNPGKGNICVHDSEGEHWLS